MADIIAIRHHDHSLFQQITPAAPIINALSQQAHPLQLLADLMVLRQRWHDLSVVRVAWLGAINNMCYSWLAAADIFGFQLNIFSPEFLIKDEDRSKIDSIASASLCDSATDAVLGCQAVNTDVWNSMGDEALSAEQMQKCIDSAQVTPELMEFAAEDAVFLHCLPAHEGEEIAQGMLDHNSSKVWEQAENRLHSAKALLVTLLAPEQIN